MNKSTITRRAMLGATAALMGACGGGDDQTTLPLAPPPPPPLPVGGNEALAWSAVATKTLIDEAATNLPGLSPMEQSRIMAMAFIAGNDAWDAIEPRYFGNYLPVVRAADANPISAYATAVHHVLRDQVPSQFAALDTAYLAALLQIPDSAGKTAGINLGGDRANAILALRANDGSANAQGQYSPGNQPGDYQPTPPINGATFVNWGAVTPFVLATASQFRAPPPWPIASAGYATEFDEVKSLGAMTGGARTADQSEIAKFWLESTPLSWQRAVNIVYQPFHGAIYGRWIALVSARLQIALADAYIAALECKYFYNYWRPITAIRAGDTDGNPATAGDVAWTPYDPVTPPVPDYVSAHATAAAAGYEVLAATLGPDTSLAYQSTSLPGVSRYFSSLAAIKEEIGLSRIYVGYHFRKAVEEGWVMGSRVGQFAAAPFY